MTLKKKNETFAQAANRFMRDEKDPELLRGVLEQLKDEQEAYKAENNIGEYNKMEGNKYAYGGPYEDLDYGNYNLPISYVGNVQPTISPRGFDGFQQTLSAPTELPMATYRQTPGMFDNLGLKASSAIGSAKSSIGDFMNSPGGAVAGQAITSALSGMLNKQAHKQLRKKAELYAKDLSSNARRGKMSAYMQSPILDSLQNERDMIDRSYSDYKNMLKDTLRKTSTGRGEYMSNLLSGMSKGRADASTQKSQSLGRETAMNNAERRRIQAANTAARMQVEQQNAAIDRYADQIKNQWLQQALAYEMGEKQAPVGVLTDISRSMAQNRMLGAMGKEYGYVPTFFGGSYNLNG